MDSEEFVETVRSENDTALSRLGSSKSLYAATGGEMDADAVYEAAANAEYAARETFETWANDEAHDAARQVFEETAAEEADHYEQVTAKLADEFEPGIEVSAVQETLRGFGDGEARRDAGEHASERTVERAGGFVGRTLASEKSKEQMVGFFVGQADPQTAQLFRDLRADLDDQLARATDLLDTVCDSETDWERAEEAATAVIQAAYEEYTEALESMGVNPKPVC